MTAADGADEAGVGDAAPAEEPAAVPQHAPASPAEQLPAASCLAPKHRPLARAQRRVSLAQPTRGHAPRVAQRRTRGWTDARARACAQLRDTARATAKSTATLCAVFCLCLFMFFGSGWAPQARYSALQLAVLDHDGGPVGAALLRAAAASPFTLVAVPPAVTVAQLIDDVDVGRYHCALALQPGASAALAASLAAGTLASYDASGDVTLVYDEGRGGASIAPLLRSVATGVVAAASASAERAARGVVATSPKLRTVVLHPVPHAGMHLAAGIAYIDCWILMLTATTIMLRMYEAWEAAGVLRTHQIAARLVHEAVVALALSFCPPAVLQCLGAGMHASTFFAFWAYAWLCMYVFGLFVTAVFRNFGGATGGLMHLVFLILNLVSSGSITPLELMPPFFRVAYGLPFYNAVAGTRTILFGSYDNLGRNVGVMFAWVAFIYGTAANAAARETRKLRAAGLATTDE